MPAEERLSVPNIDADLDAAPPAAVLWDMDGTLVDSEKVWTVSLHETAAWLGGELSVAAREDMIGSNMSRTLTIMFDDLGLPHDPDRMAGAERFMNERTERLFAQGLEWRPGALEALRMVRAAGWRNALVTNTERFLTEMALDGIGREHFAVTVCGDEVEHPKPAADPYLRAAALLGVDAAECLAVEDSPTGSLAAQRAGAAVLVVPCDIPVPAGPGRVLRESLVGLTPTDIRQAYRLVTGERAA
ncbi:HAD family hydrolase [Pseudonocardia sp. TRM90224]|uniref:HAD family hydrolase n=1 Tax=Pseudonocardia sp. TRM90224 TaxID=2812678 RepID=UPI0021077B2D|nr:HAD family phosphatase [Pseudonocardia sp. TRM90224]